MAISESISVGDLLNFFRVSFFKDFYDLRGITNSIRLEDFDSEAWTRERKHYDLDPDSEDIEQALGMGPDEGHGTELNWEDHFKRLERDDWMLFVREKFRRENPLTSARLILDARFEVQYELLVDSKGRFSLDFAATGFFSAPLLEVETRWV